jgi:hypothetical protein
MHSSMIWDIRTFEPKPCTGDWRWLATRSTAQVGGGSATSGRQREWVGAQSYRSADIAHAAAVDAMERVRADRSEKSGSTQQLVPNVEVYTHDFIDDELVIVAPPLALAEPGTRWAANSVLGQDYLLSLVACALESGLVNREALSGVMTDGRLGEPS